MCFFFPLSLWMRFSLCEIQVEGEIPKLWVDKERGWSRRLLALLSTGISHMCDSKVTATEWQAITNKLSHRGLVNTLGYLKLSLLRKFSFESISMCDALFLRPLYGGDTALSGTPTRSSRNTWLFILVVTSECSGRPEFVTRGFPFSLGKLAPLSNKKHARSKLFRV